MSGMRVRLERLETALGAGTCPACGSRRDGKVGEDVTFTLVTTPAALPPAVPAGEPEPRPCPACGHVPIQFTLSIGKPLEDRE